MMMKLKRQASGFLLALLLQLLTGVSKGTTFDDHNIFLAQDDHYQEPYNAEVAPLIPVEVPQANCSADRLQRPACIAYNRVSGICKRANEFCLRNDRQFRNAYQYALVICPKYCKEIGFDLCRKCPSGDPGTGPGSTPSATTPATKKPGNSNSSKNKSKEATATGQSKQSGSKQSGKTVEVLVGENGQIQSSNATNTKPKQHKRIFQTRSLMELLKEINPGEFK